jgi:hypothetical protein
MENINQFLDSPMLRSIAGGAIIFIIGLIFLKNQIVKLLILTVLVAAAIFFYNNYR